MKERNLYNDEFERQLKEKADQFKMYPSDKVWNEVHSSLHTRKRRFVVGMSFLIGSILFLAGTQLISPVHTTRSNSITAKFNTTTKPAASADLPDFTAGNFEAAPLSNAAEHRGSDGNQSGTTSFLLRPVNASDKPVPEIQESLLEKNTSHIKPIQPVEQIVSRKSETTVSTNDLMESMQSVLSNPAPDIITSELIPEKAVTQSSRNHSDRYSWEIYVTPTLNTHYLNGINYRTMAQALPTAPIMVVHIANVNGFVDNTPVLGYNVGGNILYRISKNISLKAGLEFSFSRYYINTYNSSPGQSSATLSSYFGYVADSLISMSNGGSSIDKNPDRFQNRYYQLSVPLGVDMKVVSKGKFQVHLGATLQPSYLLNTDAYVLSNDFSSYTKDAEAFRRWNLIAGAEAYVSYGVGKIRWEIGPQVRYQIFSTYKNSYPLQENMLNYGIRIGISKSIW
ncbi:MAG TPA: outer membrane beta-barrel protein [Puia sp.]|nr:outer membrane beta-barrel protein [Puia sp.]